MRIFEASAIPSSIEIDVIYLLVSNLGEKSDSKHANWKSGSPVLATQDCFLMKYVLPIRFPSLSLHLKKSCHR